MYCRLHTPYMNPSTNGLMWCLLSSQCLKNWDLWNNFYKKQIKFSPWFFFSVLSLSFSSSRWYFTTFWWYFTIKNKFLQKVVVVIWTSIFCHAYGQQTLWFRNGALEGQGLPEIHHEIAGNVKCHPEEILAFAKANSSLSALLLCKTLR